MKFDDVYNKIITEKYTAGNEKKLFQDTSIFEIEEVTEYELRDVMETYLRAFISNLEDPDPLIQFIIEKIGDAGTISNAGLAYLYSYWFYAVMFHKKMNDIYGVLSTQAENIDVDQKYISKKTRDKYYRAFVRAVKKWKKHKALFRTLMSAISSGR